MSQALTFPVLKPSEIVTCMAELQIPITIEDLEKPTAPRMIAVFESCTDILMGVAREQFSQPNFAVMEILEHPDLHQESITLMSFYRQLYKLVTKVGVDDFSIRDVIRPEPGRTRKILSGIINFAKFREERLAVFEQCTLKSAEYQMEKQELEEKNREVAEQVNTLRLQRAEEEPAYQKRRDENQKLAADLREFKKTQTAMTNEIEALKKAKAEVTDKSANTQFLVANGKQDCIRLRSRIVPCPEKLQQALVDMNQSVQMEKSNLQTLERRTRDLDSKIEMMTTVDQSVVSCLKVMEECESEMKKANAASAKVQAEMENIEKKKILLRDVDIKEQQMKRQLNNVEEKISRLQKQWEAKKDTNEEKRAKLDQEYQNILQERDTNQIHIDENNKKISELEMKIAELKKKMEMDVASLQDDCNKLQSCTNVFTYELARSMGIEA
ncbi:kinetochore-associated Ndc80 complex subunit nuf2 [Chytridiales sp. JEL 0842]|nr:kinetochore-associated Ndc80 complex subunit nuf2 [Chytridiales sp. JEL 0842]